MITTKRKNSKKSMSFNDIAEQIHLSLGCNTFPLNQFSQRLMFFEGNKNDYIYILLVTNGADWKTGSEDESSQRPLNDAIDSVSGIIELMACEKILSQDNFEEVPLLS